MKGREISPASDSIALDLAGALPRSLSGQDTRSRHGEQRMHKSAQTSGCLGMCKVLISTCSGLGVSCWVALLVSETGNDHHPHSSCSGRLYAAWRILNHQAVLWGHANLGSGRMEAVRGWLPALHLIATLGRLQHRRASSHR